MMIMIIIIIIIISNNNTIKSVLYSKKDQANGQKDTKGNKYACYGSIQIKV
jgi:hypothetical protein